MRDPIGAWVRESSRGQVLYEITLWSDGTSSCDCPGWVYAKKGKPRECKHTRELAGAMLDALADYQAKRARRGEGSQPTIPPSIRPADVDPWETLPPRPPAPSARPARRIRFTDEE